MIGHGSRFLENDDSLLWRGPAVKKKPPFSNACLLITLANHVFVSPPEDVFPMKSLRTSNTFCCCFTDRRLLVVGLNCPDGLASRYAIMVVQRTLTDVALRQWFVRCGSVYGCSLWQEVRFKTRFCRLRDWTSFFDHLLVSETEHLTLDWDGSNSSWAFLLDIFQIPGRKKSSHPIHLQHLPGRPGDFL